MRLLGVNAKTLDEFGAVSAQTAMEMAKRLVKRKIDDKVER